MALEYKSATVSVADATDTVARLGGRLWHLHLGDAVEGHADDDLPVGRLHEFAAFIAARDTLAYDGAASLDLYGAVCAGLVTGPEAAAESRAHLLGARLPGVLVAGTGREARDPATRTEEEGE